MCFCSCEFPGGRHITFQGCLHCHKGPASCGSSWSPNEVNLSPLSMSEVIFGCSCFVRSIAACNLTIHLSAALLPVPPIHALDRSRHTTSAMPSEGVSLVLLALSLRESYCGDFSENASPSTSVRQALRLGTRAGSCTAWSTASTRADFWRSPLIRRR